MINVSNNSTIVCFFILFTSYSSFFKSGLCVKARTESGQKLFLNICQTTEIPAPETITDTQLLEVMDDETPSNYRIPMSIGNERTETDKC